MRLHERTMNRFVTRGNGVMVTFEAREGAPAPAMVLALPTAAQPARLERLERTHHEPASLAEFAGRYRSKELQTSWDLHSSDAKLVVRMGNELIRLQPLDRNRFEHELFNVAFERGDGNLIIGFAVFSEGANGMFFERTTR